MVDRSGSMQKGERWDQARQIIEKWMMHLPVKEAAPIVYNQTTYCYPRSKTFLELNDDNRHRLIERLRRLQPEGKTRTLKALRQAYAYEGVDTIMLFTDGKPSDSEVAIFEFIDSHQDRGIVINAVALGSYSDKQETFEFLTALAERTCGSYRGR